MAADVLDDDQWLYGEEGRFFFGMKWREIGSLVLSLSPVASTKDIKEEPQPTITENGRRVSLGYTSVIQIY